jgi:hypothetical protein
MSYDYQQDPNQQQNQGQGYQDQGNQQSDQWNQQQNQGQGSQDQGNQ